MYEDVLMVKIEAQDLFNYSTQIQDNRYDYSYNFIQYADKGSWSVRFTAWYLAGLLHRNDGDDFMHAKAAINNMYGNARELVKETSDSGYQTRMSNDIRFRCTMVRYIQAITRRTRSDRRLAAVCTKDIRMFTSSSICKKTPSQRN